jgi:hypothetical protein
VDISQGMVMRVPAAKAQIEATDSRPFIVDNHDLLMVGPELNAICSTLLTQSTEVQVAATFGPNMVWMADTLDVWMDTIEHKFGVFRSS